MSLLFFSLSLVRDTLSDVMKIAIFNKLAREFLQLFRKK